MFKTVTVSFRTRQELLEGLDLICEEYKCSRSSLIETILREFLSSREGSPVQNGSWDIVTATEQHTQEVETGDGIVFLLLGGVRVGLPKNLRFQILFDEKISAFQLDLLPGQMTAANPPLSRPEGTARPAHSVDTEVRMEGKGSVEKAGTDKDGADEH